MQEEIQRRVKWLFNEIDGRPFINDEYYDETHPIETSCLECVETKKKLSFIKQECLINEIIINEQIDNLSKFKIGAKILKNE